jgi:hypothetical protein
MGKRNHHIIYHYNTGTRYSTYLVCQLIVFLDHFSFELYLSECQSSITSSFSNNKMFLYDIAQRDDPDDSSNPSLSSSDSFDSEKNRTSLIV